MKKSKYLKITSEQIYNKRRKFIKSIGLGVGSLFFYSWGLLTVNKRIFPYNFIKSIKEKFIPTPPLHEHKRFLNIENQKLINLSSINLKNLGVFVTYGQSNSSNHGQIGYIPKNKVLIEILGMGSRYGYRKKSQNKKLEYTNRGFNYQPILVDLHKPTTSIINSCIDIFGDINIPDFNYYFRNFFSFVNYCKFIFMN